MQSALRLVDRPENLAGLLDIHRMRDRALLQFQLQVLAHILEALGARESRCDLHSAPALRGATSKVAGTGSLCAYTFYRGIPATGTGTRHPLGRCAL